MEVTTEASRAEFLEVSKELDDLLMKQGFFGHKDLEFLGLSMETRIQNFFTLKHHNRRGEIIFRV